MRKRTAAIYATGHFLVDFFCAYLLISQMPDAWLFVAYNFCAFALQMPIGLLADMTGRNRTYALSGVLLVFAALLPFPITVRVLLAGCGNACFHVGGGREALLADNKMIGLGLFVSPGAVGIYMGTVLAGVSALSFVGIAVLLALAAAIWGICSPEKRLSKIESPFPVDACLMFLVVILRSLVGMCMENPWKLGIFVPFAAIAAAAGKFLGGYIADKFGGKKTGVVSLALAAILFCIPSSSICGVLGALLFNMTMPVTLKKAAVALPGYEGFSFGLLTFALFLGYIPNTMGISLSPYFGAVLSLVSAGLFLLVREKRHG